MANEYDLEKNKADGNVVDGTGTDRDSVDGIGVDGAGVDVDGIDGSLGAPVLVEGPEGLTLTDGHLEMRGDFTDMIKRIRPGNLGSEMLVKAAKLKGFQGEPLLIDATAGMGEDSLLLAAAGFRVIMYEYDPVIGALLEDTLRRAAESDVAELREAAARMELRREDSVKALRDMAAALPAGIARGPAVSSADGSAGAGLAALPAGIGAGERVPDVILLDPMFPERRKSGLIKKKFQLLQQLERPCDNEDELLAAAMGLHPRKIVIKRPLKGPFLAGVKPSYSLKGKAIRYDCIVLA